jgi:SagB-type dehydrogenase family enzyme
MKSQNLNLPKPVTSGGMPLMEALSERASARSYDTTSLSMQQISDLLWASFGINRPDGKRTAPSANNKQEIEIYVLLKTGAYVYNAQKNSLDQVTTENLLNLAAGERYAGAPVQLILIADLAKRGDQNQERSLMTANLDAGYISQNVYLYCASEGLATVVRGSFPGDIIAPRLNLRPEQKIIVGQSIGFPKP